MYNHGSTRRYSWPLILLIMSSYVLLEFLFSRSVSRTHYLIFYSLFWLFFSIASFGMFKKGIGRPFYESSYALFVPLSIVMAFFQLSFLILFSLFFASFGYSPYSHNLVGIAFNITSFFIPIVAIELIRYVLLGNTRHPTLSIITITLTVTTILSLHLSSTLKLINSVESLMEFLGSNLLVTLAENVLATYILLRGGPLSSISYRLTLISFEYLSPLLPRLPWTTKSFLFFISSMINFMIVESARPSISYMKKEKSSFSLLISATVVMIIIWFSLGFLGVYPTVIVSGSMSPLIKPGDLVIIAKVFPYRIRVGDIIQFWDGEEFIVHRVIGIKRYGDTLFFMTKGDANEVMDQDLVHQSNVMGKLVLIIPKIGWISIITKQAVWRVYSIVHENFSVSLVTIAIITIISIYFLKTRRSRRSRRLTRRKLYAQLNL